MRQGTGGNIKAMTDLKTRIEYEIVKWLGEMYDNSMEGNPDYRNAQDVKELAEAIVDTQHDIVFTQLMKSVKLLLEEVDNLQPTDRTIQTEPRINIAKAALKAAEDSM